ncbi:MAG: hypothetical protein L6Q98_16000 [Anaerolineae bacterium]|nr:hypothetical protein [Anaerolineae bacterium]NUQ06006.1 hypothetical protein [Anaerolineae bacterium]
MTRLIRLARRLLTLLAWLIRLVLMLTLLRASVFDMSEPFNIATTLVGDATFDYVTWEVGALAAKVESTLFGIHPFMSEAARADVVRAYFADLAARQALDRQIAAVYADPAAADPETATRTLRAERDSLRKSLRERQTLAEAILEGQVAQVLVAEGFGVGGQLLPPLAMRFTEVPNLLIVSPRDSIRFDLSINVDPLPVDAQAALESRVDDLLDASSLIVPLGGIALYPAMILETSSLAYAVEVFAHEWLHHYLFAFPLGYTYDFDSEARIINETTANLFGRAIAPRVLARYYPELAAARAPTGAETRLTAAQDGGESAPFDYGAAMHETRVTVDALLAEGRVAQAEAYMEERRRLFVENGYLIRKLNQAFFAFYGGYQSESRGEGGSDPIGPAAAAIRDASPSIHAWIVTMRGITSRAALLEVCACAEGAPAA